jgi:hypothetical protein
MALTREAALAAEHLAIGVTALGKANYAQHAYYGQAFFALSIGLERATKLALVIDHAIKNSGTFPSKPVLRRYGHNLKDLLERMNEIARDYGLSSAEDRLPCTNIHRGVIETLSDFAMNITRYYNLDFVTGAPTTIHHDDPMSAWFDRVTLPILDLHYKPRNKRRHDQDARLISQLIEGDSFVLYHHETGKVIDSVYEASMQTAITNFTEPYTRMYVMQIIRFVARLLTEIGDAAQKKGLADIPSMIDFFAIFHNSDEYFKDRRTWSIYKP